MSRGGRTNLLLATNTSGLPGIRLNVRRGHLVVDVTWMRDDGRRGSTSYLVNNKPLQAVQRAMRKRGLEAGVMYDISPRAAWMRLRRAINV